MKKRLSFLGAITLLGTSTTSLVACNNNIPQYNEDELQQLKKENQICTNCQEIKENLEWICPQEQPFNTVDNKWYYVVWRGEENEEWKITKFKQSDLQNKVLDSYNEYQLKIHQGDSGLIIYENKFPYRVWGWHLDTSGRYFKAVYRWNGDEQKLPDLIVDNNGNVKVNSE
ncbi:lipoprotein [Spiroplasma citri]|uniref:lipoprotein n=1 Tax=Spiroplasma citri TaxID=2133 RepID=UPI002478A1FD|nr:lipoprotein [Spiroplasma citri]